MRYSTDSKSGEMRGDIPMSIIVVPFLNQADGFLQDIYFRRLAALELFT